MVVATVAVGTTNLIVRESEICLVRFLEKRYGMNKSKSWSDIQMIISSIAVAATMGFWSLFSSNQKLTAGVSGTANLAGQPDPNAATANNDVLLPGQVMLLGSAPQAQASATPYVKVWHGGNNKNSGGSGGGGGSASVGSGGGGSNTGSSKP